MEPKAPKSSTRKLTFSFDSSGWMYVYHLGAAQYLQQWILPQLPPERVAFSGSSGGALVACALCTGINIEELARFVISCQPECEFNPWRMLPCADEAIALFLPEDSYLDAQDRLRVLLTRIELPGWNNPTAIRPEAFCTFRSRAELAQALRASCHIPLLGGLLPYQVRKPDGTSLGAFYDGLFWPSILYMWRAFNASDALLKVSGIGWPTAHVALPLPVPLHWLVLPPSRRTLWRLYAAGYDDTARYFAKRGQRRERESAATPHDSRSGAPAWTRRSEGNSPSSMLPQLPSVDTLPTPPRQRDLALLMLMALGWLHLLLLTLFCPFVPFYFAFRNFLRPTSEVEHARAEQQNAANAAASADHTSPSALHSLGVAGQLVRRAVTVVLVLALWPLVLLVLVLRILWPFDTQGPLPQEWYQASPPMSPYASRPGSPPASPYVRAAPPKGVPQEGLTREGARDGEADDGPAEYHGALRTRRGHSHSASDDGASGLFGSMATTDQVRE